MKPGEEKEVWDDSWVMDNITIAYNIILYVDCTMEKGFGFQKSGFVSVANTD